MPVSAILSELGIVFGQWTQGVALGYHLAGFQPFESAANAGSTFFTVN